MPGFEEIEEQEDSILPGFETQYNNKTNTNYNNFGYQQYQQQENEMQNINNDISDSMHVVNDMEQPCNKSSNV